MDTDTQHLLPFDERIKLIIRSLPRLEEASVPKDDSCPICLLPFSAAFDDTLSLFEEAEEEHAGITKITQCGHIFCRRDLVQWIKGMHGTCPTCRHPFLDIRPPSESEDESSDGGEYVPDYDFDTDGFTDAEDYDEEEIEREMMELEAMDDSGYNEPVRHERMFDADSEHGDNVGMLGLLFEDEGLSTADLDWLLENEHSSPHPPDITISEDTGLEETGTLSESDPNEGPKPYTSTN